MTSNMTVTATSSSSLFSAQDKNRRGFRPCQGPARGSSGVAENLLHQELNPTAPKSCGAREITYIRDTAEGIYLDGSNQLHDRYRPVLSAEVNQRHAPRAQWEYYKPISLGLHCGQWWQNKTIYLYTLYV